MVTPEHEARMATYIAAYGDRFLLKPTINRCDRCRPDMTTNYIREIEDWTGLGPTGAPPYLWIDCAQFYGLVW